MKRKLIPPSHIYSYGANWPHGGYDMSKLTHASILLPDSPVPMIIPAREEGYVSIGSLPGAPMRPFKIEKAERVDGIDYDSFVSPGMFIGAINFPGPWELSQMFSGFRWPGGGLSSSGSNIPYIGEASLWFRLINKSDNPQRFAIRLLGWEMSP